MTSMSRKPSDLLQIIRQGRDRSEIISRQSYVPPRLRIVKPTRPGSSTPCSRPTRLSDRIEHVMTTLQRAQKTVSGGSLLDLGCGGAEITEEMAKTLQLSQVCGADLSSQPPSGTGQVMTSYYPVVDHRIDLPDHSMDIITCFMTIHHWDQMSPMMAEVRRILKPHGLFFFREHDVPSEDHTLKDQLDHIHQQYPDHQDTSGEIHYWSREDLRHQLEDTYRMSHLADSDYPAHMNNRQAIYHSLYMLL